MCVLLALLGHSLGKYAGSLCSGGTLSFRVILEDLSLTTDMQEKVKTRLRESRLLAPGGGEFTQPSLRLFLHVCRCPVNSFDR